MGDALTVVLRALFDAQQTIDRQREQIQQLQAAYTDIKNQLEAKDAATPAVG